MTEVRVRPLTAADLDAVLAIAGDTPEAPRWNPVQYEAYLHAGQSPPLLRAGFVAEFGDEIQGFVLTRLLLDGEQNVCELESIAVRQSARRSGTGTLLLKALTAWAAPLGARRLELEVRAGNASAIRFYERAGLARQGIRPRYYAAPEEDALLMGSPLGGDSEKSVTTVEK